MATKLNLMQLVNMGVRVGAQMQEQTPQGSKEHGIGEFLTKLPQMVADAKVVTENVIKAKQMEKDTKEGKKAILEAPQSVEPIEGEKVREYIIYEVNNLFLEAEKNKAMLEQTNAYTFLKLVEQTQKEKIVGGIMSIIAKLRIKQNEDSEDE